MSRTLKSEVIPEDKSLVNVLYFNEVNNCGYNCEYPNRAIKFGVNNYLLSRKPNTQQYQGQGGLCNGCVMCFL
jgi:hypothetical protein